MSEQATGGPHGKVATTTPVIVGVGQWSRRSGSPGLAPEPTDMMAESLRRAADDTGRDTERMLRESTGLWTIDSAIALYSTTPPRKEFHVNSPQPEVDARPRRVPSENYSGKAQLETYTVRHDQHGEPERAIIVGRTADGARTWSRTSEPELMAALESTEMLGHSMRLSDDHVVSVSPA